MSLYSMASQISWLLGFSLLGFTDDDGGEVVHTGREPEGKLGEAKLLSCEHGDAENGLFVGEQPRRCAEALAVGWGDELDEFFVLIAKVIVGVGAEGEIGCGA